MASNGVASLTNYVAYIPAGGVGRPRIGHLDLDSNEITPLAYPSGAPISTLYEVVEAQGVSFIQSGDPIPLSSAKLLPPISGRDVLAVGKNYSDHAKEFNASGYDASDKVDMPSHPVIFTKRATSIIAHGEEIYPHPEFTQTLDYEGEIGVIVGKAGFRIQQKDAWDHVWGYTIINDVTARERQRDHKQFTIGKSADTFCPMGPIAVPASQLQGQLRVQTYVNGEKRQDGTTDDFIFSIPVLIETLSGGQTLQPGDVIATGTPAGVGFGLSPPTFLKPGDVVEVSVTGLGKLTNKVASPDSKNYTVERVANTSSAPIYNLDVTLGGVGLTTLNNKKLFVKEVGNGSSPIVFIHGLGGTNEFYAPLIKVLDLASSHKLYLADLEGHGLSPTSALSAISIETYAADVLALINHFGLQSPTIVAHSMGCYIAEYVATHNPSAVSKLILLGPPPPALADAGRQGSHARAATVRKGGMIAVADTVVGGGTSAKTQSSNPLGVSVARLSLLSQDPEGYAKGCTALATAPVVDPSKIKAQTLIITGTEDKVSPPEMARKLAGSIAGGGRTEVLADVGHWHIYEDPEGVAKYVKSFL
ncbi:fumarylacetoacetate hydrolase-like protein [Heliocybe sulcata]|uniref:Fumarylacetoacetate hydrolase-like protein n=1 Tax=Heliocybe sulcata TaxID=5364 RepID=A0A5C3N767_9AGAM|nr:fumarylacetoacetate hydrolase-like protein [Heliocybe sulcata]